jgi:hypothetical protein
MKRHRVVACAALILFVSASAVAAEGSPSGFRALRLGMKIDEAKEALRTDPLFDYRGDPDVSFLPRSAETLIECSGSSYVKRAFLQFQDGLLFSLILELQEEKLDHFTLFSALQDKYGKPASLTPRETVWQFELVRFSLEKPLTVKYLERKTFEAIKAAGVPQKELTEMARDRFVEQF